MHLKQPRHPVLIGAAVIIPWAMAWSLFGRPADASQTRPPQANPARHQALEQFNLEGLTVAREEILPGGPGKDGIPALTNPRSVAVKHASFLPATDRIVSVSMGGAVRGYPLRILTWHEAINDELGGTPIAVIYCPLCDSVSVVERRIGDKMVEFGISGLLHNSNVLLYDRGDNALWSQVGLRAISGPNAGKSLRHLPWRISTFGAFRQAHPDATVVSLDTGHRRDYGRNPYEAYFRGDRLMFPVSRQDARLAPRTRVVGVRLGERAVAYPLARIGDSPDGILIDEIDGERLVLRADAAGGIAVVEAPADAQVVHTFWFAWAAFHPQTQVFGEGAAAPPQAR